MLCVPRAVSFWRVALRSVLLSQCLLTTKWRRNATATAGDCAAWCTNAEDFPLATAPGARGEYNSGSSYILSRIVNQVRKTPCRPRSWANSSPF